MNHRLPPRPPKVLWLAQRQGAGSLLAQAHQAVHLAWEGLSCHRVRVHSGIYRTSR